jgi:hypothetical protein
MSVDGPRAQHELPGDLEVGEAGSYQPQDLRLAERNFIELTPSGC